MRIQIVMNLVGKVILTFAAFMLIPFLYSCLFEEPYFAFLFSSFLTFAIGGALTLGGIKSNSFGLREGFLIVTATWVITGFLGALPLYISGYIPSFIDALFESVSGLTATGASIMPELDGIPKAFILWRGLLHWLGGMGIIVLVLSFLKNLGADAGHLLNAEASVPVPGLVMPRIRAMATTLWGIYVLFTGICFMCLWLAGMSVFDAVNHSFSVMATGGYSSRTEGMFLYADNMWIKMTIVTFMILAGGNFTVYSSAYYNGIRMAFRDVEFRVYLGILALATVIITSFLVWGENIAFLDAVDQAIFTTVSIQTGSGFATVDYDQWPEAAKAILFILMFIGGCSGSTAGGMKVIRILLIFKSSLIHLRRAVHPGLVQAVRLNGKAVAEKRVQSALHFFFLFLLCYILSVLILTMSGVDLATSIGGVAGIIGNVGLAFGDLGPTDSFAVLNPIAKAVLILDMLLGRLEIFTVLVLLHPDFWDSYFVRKKVKYLR